MKPLKILFFLLLMTSFFNCDKEPCTIDDLTEERLFGYWESYESTPSFGDSELQFMLENTYCNSFELRSNKEFAVYYHSSGKPDKDRIDGSWSLEDQNKLIFRFNGFNVEVTILEYDGNTIKMKEKNDLLVSLRKQ